MQLCNYLCNFPNNYSYFQRLRLNHQQSDEAGCDMVITRDAVSIINDAEGLSIRRGQSYGRPYQREFTACKPEGDGVLTVNRGLTQRLPYYTVLWYNALQYYAVLAVYITCTLTVQWNVRKQGTFLSILLIWFWYYRVRWVV